MIRGVLLDYGGTIDTNGVHWGAVLWKAYEDNGVPVTNEHFRAAYAFGEKALGTRPLIMPAHNFHDVLRIKIEEQFSFLLEHGMLDNDSRNSLYKQKITDQTFAFAKEKVAAAVPVIEYLSEKYPLVLVSNFYGNINTVLEDFGVSKYFGTVVESAVVGVRKPDPGIFTLGVKALSAPAAELVVIGDSYTKDIDPGKKAGCQTIWINKTGWGDDPVDVSAADKTISDFGELKKIL